MAWLCCSLLGLEVWMIEPVAAAVVAWEVTWCGLPEAWGCLMLWQMLHDCSAQEFDLA